MHLHAKLYFAEHTLVDNGHWHTHPHPDAVYMQRHTSLNTLWFVMQCRQVLESMFEWLVPPMLRVATRMVRAPVPMQDLNLVASCMRLLDALLLPDFRDKPQLFAEMNDNVQMVRAGAFWASHTKHSQPQSS